MRLLLALFPVVLRHEHHKGFYDLLLRLQNLQMHLGGLFTPVTSSVLILLVLPLTTSKNEPPKQLPPKKPSFSSFSSFWAPDAREKQESGGGHKRR